MDILRAGDLICGSTYISATRQRRDDCGHCLWNSGIIQRSSDADSIAAQDGYAVEKVFYNPIAYGAPSRANAPGVVDPNNGCDCDSVTQSSLRVTRRMGAKCWGAEDFSRFCRVSPEDPIQEMMNQTSDWWTNHLENELASSLRGIFANNVTNTPDGEKPDMVYDATTTDNKVFDFCAYIEARRSMGCRDGELSGLLVHNDVYFNMLKSSQIENCVPDANVLNGNNLAQLAGTYNGTRVYRCDHPALIDTTGDSAKFLSVMFGTGAFKYGTSVLRDAFEVERQPCVNGGTGLTRFHTREVWTIHPDGYSDKFTHVGKQYAFPSLEDLAKAENWERVHDRKNIPFSFVVSEG